MPAGCLSPSPPAFTNDVRPHSLPMPCHCWAGWLWVALNSAPAASSSTTSCQHCLLHGHVCVLPTQHGGLGWKTPALAAAFCPACESKHMPPTSKSKDSRQTALGAAGHADGFLVPQGKRLLGGRRRWRGRGQRGNWHTGVGPLAGERMNTPVQMPKQSHDAETWRETR